MRAAMRPWHLGADARAPPQLCFLTFCSLFALAVGADGGEAPETLWTSIIPFFDSMSKMPLVRIRSFMWHVDAR